MTRYPADRLHEEVAYVAFHFHWQRDEIMRLDHRERQRWVAEIARINERLSSPQRHEQRYETRYEQGGGRR